MPSSDSVLVRINDGSCVSDLQVRNPFFFLTTWSFLPMCVVQEKRRFELNLCSIQIVVDSSMFPFEQVAVVGAWYLWKARSSL
jgi:hypothetical protein